MIIEEAGQPDSQFIPELPDAQFVPPSQPFTPGIIADGYAPPSETPLHYVSKSNKKRTRLLDPSADKNGNLIKHKIISTVAEMEVEKSLIPKRDLSAAELERLNQDIYVNSADESSEQTSDMYNLNISVSITTPNVNDRPSLLFPGNNISYVHDLNNMTMVSNNSDISHDRISVIKSLPKAEQTSVRASECSRITTLEICYCPPVPPLLSMYILICLYSKKVLLSHENMCCNLQRFSIIYSVW